jgi:AcrR family transcriptional regulator
VRRSTVATSVAGPVVGGKVLSEEAIVNAACELIAESSTEQLTMRRLSDRLGVSLGATYHYVRNRDALMALVIEELNSRIELESTNPRRWASTLRLLMVDYARVFSAYPGVAAHALKHVDAGAPTGTRDLLLQTLREAGFRIRSAHNILGAMYFYVTGTVAAMLTTPTEAGYSTDLITHQFEEGLDLLIKGAQVQLREDRAARRAAGP